MVNYVEVLATFATLIVLHDWWIPESVCTHWNLLVFDGYLLLLLLLYLNVVAFKCLFESTTITSVQHSTKTYEDWPVYLFCYCWPFPSQFL